MAAEERRMLLILLKSEFMTREILNTIEFHKVEKKVIIRHLNKIKVALLNDLQSVK